MAPWLANRPWVAVAALVALAAIAVASCTYPNFAFGDGSGSGNGVGGDGGDLTGGGGGNPSSGGAPVSSVTSSTGHPATSSSDSASASASASSSKAASSSSTGGGMPQVPCQDPSVQCAAGEVCCFHESDGSLDHCGAKGSCPAMFIEFSCNSDVDCPGTICCATVDGGTGFVTGVSCAPSCNGANNHVMCDAPADCSDLTCDAFLSISYPGYGWCLN